MANCYVFIDGGYLRAMHAAAMKRVFLASPELNIAGLRNSLWNVYRPERVFFYDCLNHKQRPGEGDTEFETRVRAQEDWFRSIRSLPGWFVKLGTLTGSRASKLRQKEVDVMLATDMLEHSSRKNMDTAVLLAGDRDFTPVVEALVRLGTIIRVMYYPRDASPALYEAADEACPITIGDLHSWSQPGSGKNRLPEEHGRSGEPDLRPRTVIREGRANDCRVRLWSEHAGVFTLHLFEQTITHQYDHADCALLERYIVEKYGELTWTASAKTS